MIPSVTITDPAVLAQLLKSDGVVEVRDPSGRVLGTFRGEVGRLPAGVKSPVSEEELERRRAAYRDGKPLADILKRLQAGQ